jgi:hypothetical protein
MPQTSVHPAIYTLAVRTLSRIHRLAWRLTDKAEVWKCQLERREEALERGRLAGR